MNFVEFAKDPEVQALAEQILESRRNPVKDPRVGDEIQLGEYTFVVDRRYPAQVILKDQEGRRHRLALSQWQALAQTLMVSNG